MTIPAGEFDRRFAEGWAQVIAAAGIGVDWQPTTPYAGTQTGIGLMTFPSSLNRAVALTPYLLSADPVHGDDWLGLQVRTRSAASDPRDCWALDNAISDVVLGRSGYVLPTGVAIVQLTAGPAGSTGRDDNERWTRVANYPCLTFRPTTHRV